MDSDQTTHAANTSPDPVEEKLTIMQVLRRDLDIVNRWITESIDWLMNRVFDATEWGGRLRRWLFILSGAIVWASAAFNNMPSLDNVNGFDHFILYPFQALFAAVVFRHVLVMGLSFWIATQVAANYLDDVFELNDPDIAERYIMQASLADLYRQIDIEGGKIDDDQLDSTLVRIGGPGLVRVHYDSAALFEKYDGDPTVIVAEDGLVSVDRFERLRKVISLRDHIDETRIKARTRDGITIIANGVRVKFYVHRDEVEEEDLETVPYPIIRQAVKTLVYKESVTKRIDPLTLKTTSETPPEVKHPEILDLNPNPILGKLKSFIASATLSEFLAAIGEKEIQQRQVESDTLEMEALSLTGEIPVKPLPPEDDDAKPVIKGDFYTRREITDLIYGGNDHADRLATGLELDWIDIGTWELPKNARNIVEQHRDAWLLSLENLNNRSPQTLGMIESESQTETLQALLSEIIMTYTTRKHAADQNETINKLLHLYRQKLAIVQDLYRSSPDFKATPLPIIRTLSQLNDVLNLTHTLREK